MDKAALRRRMRELRRALTPAQRHIEATATATTLVDLLHNQQVHAVASYLALPDELDQAEFHRRWWQAGRTVFVPRVLGPGCLDWHCLVGERDLAQLRPGAYGIPEPDPAALPSTRLPTGIPLLVPGLAFTIDGRRLGQGGGFYDRLIGLEGRLAIGIGFACQRVEELPEEAHDRRVAALVLGGTLILKPPDTTA